MYVNYTKTQRCTDFISRYKDSIIVTYYDSGENQDKRARKMFTRSTMYNPYSRKAALLDSICFAYSSKKENRLSVGLFAEEPDQISEKFSLEYFPLTTNNVHQILRRQQH